MNRNQALRHKKKKSHKKGIIIWLFVFALVATVIMYLFAYAGAESVKEILQIKEFWLSNGVVDGLLIIAFLMLYRVDAQNIAMNENDLEDTEWLTVKKLKKLNEFNVTSWNNSDKADDGIVIGAEKRGEMWKLLPQVNFTLLLSEQRVVVKLRGLLTRIYPYLAKVKENHLW